MFQDDLLSYVCLISWVYERYPSQETQSQAKMTGRPPPYKLDIPFGI